MNHKGTKRIQTPRLTLRPFTLDDAPAMYENWASDPEVTKFLSWPTHANVEISRTVLEGWIPLYEKPDCYLWAIVLNPLDTRPIGSISVVRQDEKVGMMEIGYCIGREWWGRGITTEALGGVIDFLIGEVGVNRVQARHDPDNRGSGRVMEKCGMKYEGIHRAAHFSNRGLCDVAMYAILAGDLTQAAN